MNLRKIVLLISLLPLLAFANQIQEKNNKTIELSILTQNAWMVPFQRRRAIIRSKLIGKELPNYDFSMIQEVFTRGMRNRIKRAAGVKTHIKFPKNPWLLLNSGLLTFSKHKVIQSDFLPFKNCSGVQCITKRGTLYVEFELPNGSHIDIFNTHLQAYESSREVRSKQLNRIIGFINKHNQKTHNPIIFSGDFNIIDNSDEYIELENLMYINGFRDSWREINPNLNGYTWNADKNSWARKTSKRESEKKQRLDYIWIKDGDNSCFDVLSAKLAFNTPVTYRRFGKIHNLFISDHFGVNVKLKLNFK